jgi:hypothetical protein
MQQYTVNNRLTKTNIKTFEVDSTNSDNRYFEYYMKYPHNLPQNSTVNISDANGIPIQYGINIGLRKQIKVGINVKKMLKWRYADNSNEWQDIKIVSTTAESKNLSEGTVTSIDIVNGGTGYSQVPTVSILGGNGSGAVATAKIGDGSVTSITITNSGSNYTVTPDIVVSGGGTYARNCGLRVNISGYHDLLDSRFTNFEISFVQVNGYIRVKEKHSNEWQDLVNLNDIPTNVAQFSDDSIIKTVLIKDTYLRIEPFNMYRAVNLTDFGFVDAKRTEFIFSTDYIRDANNRFIDSLITKVSPTVTDGVITAVTVQNGGTGYTWATAEVYGDGTGAAVSVSLSGGVISAVNILDGGANYSWAFIKINGDGKTTTLTPYKDIDKHLFLYENFYDDEGVLIGGEYKEVSITVTDVCSNGGEDYYTFISNGCINYIKNLTVSSGGTGYTYASLEIIGDGEGAAATATVSGGRISSVTLINGGTGYTWATVRVYGDGVNGKIGTTLSNADIKPNCTINYDNVTAARIGYNFSNYILWKDYTMLGISIPFNESFSIKTQQSDLTQNKFFEVEKERAINPVIDNERVQFEPYYKDKNTYYKVNKLVYSFIFNDNNSYTSPATWKQLGFGDDDVKYQKNRLKKTFVTLSYYNEQSPTNQLMEYYSTIFVNTNLMYAHMINNLKNISGVSYVGNVTVIPQETVDFTVYHPFVNSVETTSGARTVKLNYTGGSEGYYIYLFGSEYKNCKPAQIFLKGEFNNAKTGKRILFFNRNPTFSGNKPATPTMDNVFFDLGNSKQWIYTPVNVEFNIALNKYVYYFDNVNNNITWNAAAKTLTVKFYEAAVK